MICWACETGHTGTVWCPHCSAPVDPGSEEARRSPWWQDDPRLHVVRQLTRMHRGAPLDPAAAQEFGVAIDAVKQAMTDGRISTEVGQREIARLISQAPRP